MDTLTLAITMCLSRHEKSYVYEHLDKVLEIGEEIQMKHGFFDMVEWAEIVAPSLLLHDIIEDTSVTKLEIEEIFGPIVLDTVWRVTDAPGKNRKERKLLTYKKICGKKMATFVKLCDRIQNVSRGGKIDMYLLEQEVFEKELRTSVPELEPVWFRLEEEFRNQGVAL